MEPLAAWLDWCRKGGSCGMSGRCDCLQAFEGAHFRRCDKSCWMFYGEERGVDVWSWTPPSAVETYRLLNIEN